MLKSLTAAIIFSDKMIKAHQVKRQIERLFKGMPLLDIDVEYSLDENFSGRAGKKTGGVVFFMDRSRVYSRNPKHVPSKIPVKAHAFAKGIRVDCTVGCIYFLPKKGKVEYEWVTCMYDFSDPVVKYVDEILQEDLGYKIKNPITMAPAKTTALPKIDIDPEAEQKRSKDRHDYNVATSGF